jgi:SAM-dependent methyltransferase
MPSADAPPYLQPYLSAAQRYGSGFGSLLWASPKTQAVRFRTLLGFIDITGKRVLDVGCGRADLLEYMLSRARYPQSYVGLEAVDALADAAEKKRLPNCRIIRGDFVSNPNLLNLGADVVLISGTFNTMTSECFYASLTAAIAAAGQALVFNFLCSPYLAGASHLTWHLPEEVLEFCRGLSPRVEWRNDYLPGDATVCVWKEKP